MVRYMGKTLMIFCTKWVEIEWKHRYSNYCRMLSQISENYSLRVSNEMKAWMVCVPCLFFTSPGICGNSFPRMDSRWAGEHTWNSFWVM